MLEPWRASGSELSFPLIHVGFSLRSYQLTGSIASIRPATHQWSVWLREERWTSDSEMQHPSNTSRSSRGSRSLMVRFHDPDRLRVTGSMVKKEVHLSLMDMSMTYKVCRPGATASRGSARWRRWPDL